MYDVAPLVGAWIEIPMGVIKNNTPYVAPLVGAWIEITIWAVLLHITPGRSPCGSVD